MKDKELDKNITRLEQELKKPLEAQKGKYQSTEIPEELNETIRKQIQKVHKKEVSSMKKYYLAALPAAAVLAFTVGLNTSYSFASTMERVPVIGTVAKVLTVRSYQEKDEDKEINVEIPKVEVTTKTKEEKQQAVDEMVVDVNKEIDKAVEEYVTGAEQRIEEYKQAFIQTGGTEEEFKEKNIKVNVDYQIKYQGEDYVSFVVTGDESWSGAYAVNYYYNLDMRNGQYVTLKDLLGENYVDIANQQILAQMQERTKENSDLTYFSEEEGGFTTVTENTNFYINGAGNPVVVFDKYEVAPGFMGRQEFEITRE